MLKLSVEKFLMGRIKEEELTPEMKADMYDLLDKVNRLLFDFYTRNPDEKERIITSGYRSPAINAAAGGAKKSKHMLCQAIDLSDSTGTLGKWLTRQPDKLSEFDLYMEAKSATPTWVHLQLTKPRSGKRIFLP